MASQQTAKQARVIDPVLSNVAQGWKHPDHVWRYLFPPVPVKSRGGQVIKFGREDFRRQSGASGRAPGSRIARLQFGYSDVDYTLKQFALEGIVPVELGEEAMAVPGIDAASLAAQKVLASASLETEIRAAALATKAASFDAQHKVTLAGASQWSHADSDPSTQIAAARDAIRKSTGMYPNVCIVGAKAMSKGVRFNDKLLDRTKHTSRDSITTDLLQTLWGIQTVREGMGVYLPENAADDADFTDVWGNFAVVAYVAPASLAEMGSPSYGYTYQLDGYPRVAMPYYEEQTNSWVYPVFDECTPTVTFQDAAYLISSVVA